MDEINWIGTYKCMEEGTKALVVSRAKMIDEVTHKPVIVWIGFIISMVVPNQGNRYDVLTPGIWTSDGNYFGGHEKWNLKEAIRETST